MGEEGGDKFRLWFPVEHEDAVKHAFAILCEKLGYRIREVRKDFPDYLLEDSDGRLIGAEVEYLASDFIRHKHPIEGCDLIICWID